MRVTRTLTVAFKKEEIREILAQKVAKEIYQPPKGFGYVVEECFGDFTVYLKPEESDICTGCNSSQDHCVCKTFASNGEGEKTLVGGGPRGEEKDSGAAAGADAGGILYKEFCEMEELRRRINAGELLNDHENSRYLMLRKAWEGVAP